MLFTFQTYCTKIITKTIYTYHDNTDVCLVKKSKWSDGQLLKLTPNKISINFEWFAKKILVTHFRGHIYMGSEPRIS